MLLYSLFGKKIKSLNYYTKDLVMKMRTSSGITSESTKSMSFDALVQHLRNMDVITTTKACLERIHTLCVLRHGSVSRACKPANVNVRVFLAAFMIAYRPTHVFKAMGPTLEQPLFEAAVKMIKSFELICDAIINSSAPSNTFKDAPHELTSDFEALLVDFLVKFKAWKVQDAIQLTRQIKHALIALYQVCFWLL